MTGDRYQVIHLINTMKSSQGSVVSKQQVSQSSAASALLSLLFSHAGCGMLVGSVMISVSMFFSFLPYSTPFVLTVLPPHGSDILLFIRDCRSCAIG